MKLIAVVFTADRSNTTEKIKEYRGLGHRFCDILTNEDIKKDGSVLSKYQGLIDCTSENKIYDSILNSKRGMKINDKVEYLKTTQGKIIVKGPNILQLTATNFSTSQEVVDKYNRDIESYKVSIEFISLKIPKLKSLIMAETGLENGGIIINEVLGKDNQKIYKLVLKIPAVLEPNVEYIPMENLEIFKELKRLGENIA